MSDYKILLCQQCAGLKANICEAEYARDAALARVGVLEAALVHTADACLTIGSTFPDDDDTPQDYGKRMRHYVREVMFIARSALASPPPHDGPSRVCACGRCMTRSQDDKYRTGDGVEHSWAACAPPPHDGEGAP